MKKIVIIGEAFGAREELFNHPFVGYSGIELAKMLGEAGLAPLLPMTKPSELEMISYWERAKATHGIILANVFPCRPPDNNVEFFFTTAKNSIPGSSPLRIGKYIRPEMFHHVETLLTFLANTQPNLIIALGNTACWAVLGEGKISQIRGTIKLAPELGIKVIPTYHPAAILRQWNLRPIALADLVKANKESDFTDVRRKERWIIVEPTLAEIAEWIERPADFYAVDIETSIGECPLGQIAMLGIARSDSDAIVIPFADNEKPGWSYWPTVEEEIEAWRLLDRAMKRPVPKIFQNGIYDLTYMLRAHLRPKACVGDTMLLHHSLYPEMLKGLGFLGSIYTDEIAWKSMRRKGNNLKRDE